jgi:hypothetical protein
VPSQSTNSNSANTQENASGYTNNANSYNVYGGGQSGLQNQLAGNYSNLIGGGLSSFTNNPNLVSAYQTAYNQTAPATAMQGGAGSPQLQSNYAMGLQSLLANQFNTGTSNYENALSGAGSTAFNALGTNNTTSGTSQGYTAGQNAGTQTISQNPLMMLLMSALGVP